MDLSVVTANQPLFAFFCLLLVAVLVWRALGDQERELRETQQLNQHLLAELDEAAELRACAKADKETALVASRVERIVKRVSK
jgi:hypothetical protein